MTAVRERLGSNPMVRPCWAIEKIRSANIYGDLQFEWKENDFVDKESQKSVH